jgi:hypothetical protein
MTGQNWAKFQKTLRKRMGFSSVSASAFRPETGYERFCGFTDAD